MTKHKRIGKTIKVDENNGILNVDVMIEGKKLMM